MRLLIGIIFLMLSGAVRADEVGGGGPAAGASMVSERSAVVFGKTVTGREQDLRRKVVREIIDRYAQKNGIEVTPAELDAVLAVMDQEDKEHAVRMEKRREELAKALESTTLNDEGRAKKTRELENVVKIQAGLAKTQNPPTPRDERDRLVKLDMGENRVLIWKVNRALYEKYGGKVTYDWRGPEPLDAYLAYFKELQAAGEIKFPNAETETAFWNYFTDEKNHRFLPEAKAKQVMENPWWTQSLRPNE